MLGGGAPVMVGFGKWRDDRWVGRWSYGTVSHTPFDHFACFRIDAYGAGAVDCVVCYYGLGEDI
jgi:hypothetical protein